jgi:hypothetical protein
MQTLLDSVFKEVQMGWVLRLPIRAHTDFPHAMICPMGIAEQIHYALDGSFTYKERITHDQTFTILPEIQLVNNLTDILQYPPMIYGFCLQRVVEMFPTLWC